MKKRRGIIASTVAVVLIALAFVVVRVFSGPPEPSYEGYTLSQCLAYLPGDPDGKFIVLSNKSSMQGFGPQFAIRQMGTKAVPALVQMLTNEDAALETKFFELARRQSLIEFEHVSERQRRRRAVEGFRVLGPLASNAVPELVRAADHTNSDVRLYALESLRWIHSQPELSVPALIKALKDPVPIIPYATLQGLGEFGPDASAAVPALVKIIEDNRPKSTNLGEWRTGGAGLDFEAYFALKKIDPVAAEKIRPDLLMPKPVKQGP